ncbi:MAG: hypothetical protein AAF502_23155 [Bacteroidota bacterium]
MKLKSIFAIFGLLAIGFVMGMLTSGQLMKSKVSKIAKMRTADGLEKRIYTLLDADDELKARLSPKLKPYTAELEKIRQDHKRSLMPVFDSIRVELESELSSEQVEKLDGLMKKLRRPGPPKGKVRSNGKKRKKPLSNE